MTVREITYAEAADLLAEWGDRRISPLVGKSGRGLDGLDWSLEPACDELCRWLADAPERSLDDVPRAELEMLNARLLFAVGACRTQPDQIIGSVPAQAGNSELLAALLGVQLAATRLPSEWRPQ